MWLRVVFAGFALLVTACGTGGTDLAVDEPTPQLFDDDDDLVTSSTTTDAPALGIEQLAAAELPQPRATPGVVIVDGIALAVDERTDAAWFARSPCGVVFSADEPVEQALVVLDPAGDARIEVDGSPLSAINHTIADILASELRAAGVDTVLTRDGDDDIAASVRSEAASASGALVVVSISIAEGGGELVDRAPLEVAHPASDVESRRLAGLVFQSVEPILADLPGAWTAAGDPGVRSVLNQRGTDFFTLLRDADDHARVVMHLPVLTDDTVDLFRSPVTSVSLAQALADAIARFLLTDEEGRGFVTPAEVVRDAPTTGAEACVDPFVVEASVDDES